MTWKHQIRYRLARRLIYMGLFVMPPGRYKAELLERLWELYDDVVAVSNSCQCQPLTRYTDAPHDEGCPLYNQ